MYKQKEVYMAELVEALGVLIDQQCRRTKLQRHSNVGSLRRRARGIRRCEGLCVPAEWQVVNECRNVITPWHGSSTTPKQTTLKSEGTQINCKQRKCWGRFTYAASGVFLTMFLKCISPTSGPERPGKASTPF